MSAARADELFAAYSEPLLRYCRRRLGCADEAEDAVQTTFLYATKALQRGVVPECESAWLHTIAKNVCRWQRRTAARAACDATDPLEGPIADAPAREDGTQLAFEVREALARIPERQRQALVLREVHGLPASEIASTLGLGAGETYALLSRARRSFTKAYELLSGRRSLGVHVAPLLLKVKALLGGGAATVVAATAIAGGVAVGVSGASEQAKAPATRAQVPVQAPARTPAPPALGIGDGALSGVPHAPVRERVSTRRGSATAPTAPVAGADTRAPVQPGAPSVPPEGTPPEGESPRNDAPAPAPAPSPGVPVPAPGEPPPLELPELGVDLPLESAPLPEVDAEKILDDLVPPVLDEAPSPLPLPGIPTLTP